MVKQQREVTPRVAWMYVVLGLVIIGSSLIRDWSQWPDFRTILGAVMAVFGVMILGTGVYALWKAPWKSEPDE
ncbi:hypothetical protein [Tsukamurella strandjordii]|uniref:Uncharacterized protein n=1 Tax=Tsukamurella strandjordii TaxID=147577 RepID=A0AA90SK91_9ACTN|nr:hypothetical protein [Tsukamurella strandjordii]MDP0397058.1 hypothetical protein [Tsukamurella strandjordii]